MPELPGKGKSEMDKTIVSVDAHRFQNQFTFSEKGYRIFLETDKHFWMMRGTRLVTVRKALFAASGCN
jgi:hypothetical protein